MRLQYYNGFYGDKDLQCDMNGFILQYGNEENLTLNFPEDGPVIPGDNFLPNGTFSIVPPDQGIQCTRARNQGNYTVNFSPMEFSGLPNEAVVRYTSYCFTISGKTKTRLIIFHRILYPHVSLILIYYRIKRVKVKMME